MSPTSGVRNLFGNQGSIGTATSNEIFQAGATNGVPGYSYLWEFVSNPDAMTFVNPTSSSSQRIRKIAEFNGSATYVSTFRCKVTDSAGNVSYTPTCTFTANFESNA